MSGPRTTFSRLHGTTAADVPRWAVLTAYAVPFTVLPSSIWRIVTIFSDERHGSGDVPEWVPMWVYVTLLSILSELLAFTALGLVATWGEVWPRWLPFLQGRRVPRPAAVVPAALGAVVLTLVWTIALGCIGQECGRARRRSPTRERPVRRFTARGRFCDCRGVFPDGRDPGNSARRLGAPAQWEEPQP